jgi:hypothetical protein
MSLGTYFLPAKTNRKRILIALCCRHNATLPRAELRWMTAKAIMLPLVALYFLDRL